MRTLLIAGAAALALTGCSAGRNPEPSRAKATVDSAQPPANLPIYLKPYPGARILKSMSNRRGGLLVMEADAPAEKVMEFYKAEAAQAGLRSRLDSRKIGLGLHIGPHVVVFSAAGKGHFSASVASGKGVTKVDLVYAAS
jgi:hypothetical protein